MFSRLQRWWRRRELRKAAVSKSEVLVAHGYVRISSKGVRPQIFVKHDLLEKLGEGAYWLPSVTAEITNPVKVKKISDKSVLQSMQPSYD